MSISYLILFSLQRSCAWCGNCPSYSMAKDWSKQFQMGQESLKGDWRTRKALISERNITHIGPFKTKVQAKSSTIIYAWVKLVQDGYAKMSQQSNVLDFFEHDNRESPWRQFPRGQTVVFTMAHQSRENTWNCEKGKHRQKNPEAVNLQNRWWARSFGIAEACFSKSLKKNAIPQSTGRHIM